MKNIKRLTAIVLALLIFALTLPTVSVFAADSDARYGRTKLTADQQFLYDSIAAGIKDAKANIEVNITGKNFDLNKDLSKIVTMVYSDYPEYFWFTNGWGASATSNGTTTTLTLTPSYAMTGSALSTAKSKYNSKVDELTSGLNGKSDYEKSKILHDRLADTVTYTSTSNDQNAYGALVEGKAVCNGYARAYQHLMNEAGIPTWYVTGSSNNPSTGEPIGHAWNVVKLDGKWYYTDVTWDDQGENIFYEYLNVNTSKIEKDHVLGSDYKNLVPKATSTDANYYKKENREFSSYDQEKLVKLLKQDDNKTQIYINGDVNSFLNSVGNNLLAIAKKLGASGAFQVSYIASTLQNAAIINVIVVSENHTHKTKTTVKQVDATCLSNGTKAHYVCDCGIKFSDSACTKQIASDSELIIPAKSHSISGWKNDASWHWKECNDCGCEIANTRAEHGDKNKDNKCDTCKYALPVEDESGNIVLGGGTSASDTNSSANSTSSDTSKPTTSNDNDVTSTPSDSTTSEDDTDVSTDEETDNETTEDEVTTDEFTSEIEEIIEETDSDDDGGSKGIGTVGWIVIIVAGIAVASVTTFLIMYFSKK